MTKTRSFGSYRQPSSDYLDGVIGSISPPSFRPSTTHNFRGDVKVQDIFVESIETHRKRKDTHRVLFPGTDRFEMERMDMWNHDTICTPCLILQPKTASEVSSCVLGYAAGVRRCLSDNVESKVEMTVPRLCIAGGRNSIHSMKEGSIVLDLKRMRNVTVNKEKRTCTVQGGTRVSDLDSALGEHGLIAITGIGQNLGVVGCILAGGFGYASRKYGLACDNVLDVDIVLADGRLKRCSAEKHPDLFWSLMGGGGGLGVIVSMTLKCYPMDIAAVLSFEQITSNTQQRHSLIHSWSMWLYGSNDITHKLTQDNKPFHGTPNDVFSYLILPTNSTQIKFFGCSIDTEAIPQNLDVFEQFREFSLSRKSKLRSLFHNYEKPPFSLERIPGLSDLKYNRLGNFSSEPSNFEFQLVRYHDELQGEADQHLQPGNAYISFKFANSLSDAIVKILCEATIGECSCHNGSRIFIFSIGKDSVRNYYNDAAFDAREAKYVIFIEGKWDAHSESRELKEKKKVSEWVQKIVNQLNKCEGIQSTAHPESVRDQISKTGNSNPPSGYYNFSHEKGTRLLKVKKRRDQRNVFSLASRISFLDMKGKKSNNCEL